MDENSQRQNKLQVFYQQVRTSFFNIMFELLKEKKTGVFFGCLMILIAFIQLIGLIFEPDKYGWRDQFFLNFVLNLCGYSRILGAINSANSVFFYWTLMLFGVIYLVTMIGLLVFMNYFLKNRKHYVEQVVQLLRIMIILMQWIFYLPFFESFISILKCNPDGTHYMDTQLVCFQGIHIFFFVMCMIFLALLFLINVIVAMLFNETQPVQEDCLSRMESSFEVALVIYRSLVGAFATFCSNQTCSWILITVYIVASALLCFQYYKQVPYYNSFVSVFCGSIIFSYFWVSFNALLMMFLQVDGHIIIIIVGIPMIAYLVRSLRESRIESLMKTNIEKLGTDIDALIQVHKMVDFSRGTHRDPQERMTMIGVINLHIAECQLADCPCKENYELFDIKMNDFTVRNYGSMHQDEVFLSHFIKKLYDDALNKFVNSPGIHIGFSYYLFKVMNNIHASLLELNIAQKKKPSLQQQFTIFRYKNIIEDYIVQDHVDHKEVYPQLTNVIEFERLFADMQKTIEQVSNLQVEFWTHLTTLVPDLNVLNELGKKIYLAAEQVDKLWALLCQINPHYQHALTLYGEYLKEIRNHEHLGTALIEKSFSNMAAKKAMDEYAASSDVLFSDDTTILHVSGNKESIGKILNSSQGLQKVFGYSKNEVVGHSVNILMPAIFAKPHTEFMERFFKTGRQIIFYQERQIFATHRNGHCFHMKILVKQFPNLIEGIQYVGMVKPITADFEYIITDMDGVIDSFTKGITGLLNLSPNIFKDKDTQINLQILAPDLIQFFTDTFQRGKIAKSKFREPGGEPLTLIVPQDFNMIVKSEAKSSGARSTSKSRRHGNNQQNNSRHRSAVFRRFIKALQRNNKKAPSTNTREGIPTAAEVLKTPEYQKCDKRKDVQCEILFLEFRMNSTESTKMLVFKLSKNVVEKDHKGIGGDDIGIPGIISRMQSKKFVSEHQPQKSNKSKSGTGGSKKQTRGQLDDSDDQSSLEENAFGGRQNFRHGGESSRQGTGASSKKAPYFSSKVADENSVSDGEENHSNEKQQLLNKLNQNSQKSGRGTDRAQSYKSSNKRLVQDGSQVGSNKLDSLAASKEKSKSQADSNAPGSKREDQEVSEGTGSSHDDDDSEGTKKGSQDRESVRQPSVKSVKSARQKQQSIKESQRDDVIVEENEEDYETPRMDVTALKLDVAQQKEKVSFFEELKKQSFIMSDNSTAKVDKNGKLNVTDQQKQEKISFEKQQKELYGSVDQKKDQSDSSDKKDSPQKMAKVPYGNKFQSGRFFGGDDEEPQDMMNREDSVETEEEKNEEKPLVKDGSPKVPTIKSQTKEKSVVTGQSEEEDESSGNEEDPNKEDSKSLVTDEDLQSNANNMPAGQSVKSEVTKNNGQSTLKDGQQSAKLSNTQEATTGKIQIPAMSTTGSKKTGQDYNQVESKKGTLPQSQNNNGFRNSNLQAPDITKIGESFQSIESNHGHKSNQGSRIAGHESDRRHSKNQQYASGGSSPDARDNKNNASDNEGNEDDQLIKKRDTSKIKTNPKYKCKDEGSDQDVDDDDGKQEDFGQLSSKEIDFRETIIKQEKKRLKKERKLKEKEIKKSKALNGGEEGTEADTAAGSVKSRGSTGTSGAAASEDEEDAKSSAASSSSSDSSTDSKAGGTAGASGKKKLSRKASLRETDDGDVSSVSTRRSKTERNHYILRTAIDEKYVPRSIKNLRFAAYLIFFILTFLSIVYYVIQISLFNKINQNIVNIHNSEERLGYIIDITLRTRSLTLLSGNYLNFPNGTTGLNSSIKSNSSLGYAPNNFTTNPGFQALMNTTIGNLRDSAMSLKKAQTDLSLQTASMSQSQLDQINPSNVNLTYNQYRSMPGNYYMTMWEAIMEIIVSAFGISTLNISQITDSQDSVSFVMKNCLNSILEALNNSTDAIINESSNSKQSNMQVFLYLLIAASCSLFISLVFLIPVINKVKKNKQEVLELFTHKNIDKYIDDQLKVCRNFVSLRLQQNNEAAGEQHDLDENGAGNGQAGGTAQGDRELQNELGANKFLRRNKKKSKGKKWKKLNSDIVSTLLKFLLFIAIIEGYFLANYLLSSQFLSEVQELTGELKLLISRNPTQSFLLLINIEMIYSNGTSLIEGQTSDPYVPTYLEQVYDEEEQLLDIFSSNYAYHSSEYNDLFNNIVYSDMCQYVPYNSQADCESFNQGILSKGLYSSVIQYWDFLRQLNHDFLESQQTAPLIRQYLNDPRLVMAQEMQDYYFDLALTELVNQLEIDINTFFDTEFVQNRTIFILYIFYIALLYFLIWRKFVGQLQNELWKTKSMLGILPIKVCFDIEEIRHFIYANSSNDFLASKL